jgi:hypothetical protein
MVEFVRNLQNLMLNFRLEIRIMEIRTNSSELTIKGERIVSTSEYNNAITFHGALRLSVNFTNIL